MSKAFNLCCNFLKFMSLFEKKMKSEISQYVVSLISLTRGPNKKVVGNAGTCVSNSNNQTAKRILFFSPCWMKAQLHLSISPPAAQHFFFLSPTITPQHFFLNAT